MYNSYGDPILRAYDIVHTYELIKKGFYARVTYIF